MHEPIDPTEHHRACRERDIAHAALRGEPSRRAASMRRFRSRVLDELDAELFEVRSAERVRHDVRLEAQVEVLERLKRRLEGIHKHPDELEVRPAASEVVDGSRQLVPPRDSSPPAEPQPGDR